MRTMTHARRCSLRPALLLATLTILTPSLAHAGAPLELCSPGVPFRWANGGTNIPWNPDQGPLGPLTNEQGVALTAAAFAQWGAVPTASTTYFQDAALPVDVDLDNFLPYLIAEAPDGLSAVVFDHDGAIFDFLFGPDSGVLGFAGPEWLDPASCRIVEGVAFLNGPELSNTTIALDIMVHEFGHYQNLSHSVVNGQIVLGDSTGPTPFNTFPVTSLVNLIETMYPFYFGPLAGTSTPHKDDIAMISALYPETGFAASTGTFKGRILSPNGTPKTGFNVIARNIADPFADAVSAISSDFTRDYDPDAPLVGTYTLRGLTPGAQYAIFVDYILEGAFSTPAAGVLIGPEEFYSGANESRYSVSDPPNTFAPVRAAAGITRTGVNITFNGFEQGAPLPVGDEGAVGLALPFSFWMCGQRFNEVIVNANGTLSFGVPNGALSNSTVDFLAGPAQIAGAWADLNVTAGGSVSFSESSYQFTVSFNGVPEFAPDPENGTGSNTFSISLKRLLGLIEVKYGAMSMQGGLAGVSCGGAVTSGFEHSSDLSARAGEWINLLFQPAVFQEFEAGASPNDLSGLTLRYTPTTPYSDFRMEPNNSLAGAHRISLPFSSISVAKFTEIGNEDDVDFYRFDAKAGDVITAQILSSQLDTVMALYDRRTGELLAEDDDGGVDLLSKIVFTVPADGEYAIAVSTFPDLEFDGGGEGSGRYVLSVQSGPATESESQSSALIMPTIPGVSLFASGWHVPVAERLF
jgi:hypothetical protein